MQSIEMVGEKFNLSTYLASQELCRNITQRISSQIGPGISEKEGQNLIKEEFRKDGVTKFWHPSKFRFGPDTTKSFRELPDESARLEAGDIFFLDVGPVIDEHEADYGKTFVLPAIDQKDSQLKTLADASSSIWQKVAKQWRDHKLSGVALLEYAEKAAQSSGLRLNPAMAGHRLGDFPHALFSRDSLFSVDLIPKKNLWVLEIHLLNPALQRGAFFEDILA
jgi:Xaa-Pro aminopeptidase